MTKKTRNSLLRKAVRTARLPTTFESLEARLLFDTDTWMGGSSINWSDRNNWDTHHVPNPGDDVVFNVNTTVQVDANYGSTGTASALHSLTIIGNSAVHLLDSIDGGSFDFTGDIVLNQTDSHGATLEFGLYQPTASTYTLGATIAATNFVSTGNSSGWSGLVLDSNCTAAFSGDIQDTYNTVFNLSIAANALLDVSGYAQFGGKQFPTLDPSNIVNNGELDCDNTIEIGNRGVVNFTNNGVTYSTTIGVGPQSELDVNGTSTTESDVLVGDYFAFADSFAAGAGAKVVVTGELDVGDTLLLTGGIGTLVDVKGVRSTPWILTSTTRTWADSRILRPQGQNSGLRKSGPL